MTTRKKRTTKIETAVVEPDAQEILEEVVIKQLPQLYQSTISVSVGPHEPKAIAGHIQFSETTGLMTAICQDSNYDVQLELLAQTGISMKENSAVMFSPNTKEWLLNIHKATLPRNWAASEAWNRDEI